MDEVLRSLGEGSLNALTDLVKKVDALVAEPKEPDPVAPDSNPFLSLFDFAGWSDDGGNLPTTSQSVGALRADSEIEAVIRSQAILEARRCCQEFYDGCKRALKMPCF